MTPHRILTFLMAGSLFWSCATSHRANLEEDDMYYGVADARRDFNKERRNPSYNAREQKNQPHEEYYDEGDVRDNNPDGRSGGASGSGQTIINNYYNYGPSSSLWWFNSANVLWLDPWYPGWSFSIYVGPTWWYRPWWHRPWWYYDPWYNPWAWGGPGYWWVNPWCCGNPWAWNNPWYWNNPWAWNNPWYWSNPWVWNPYNPWAAPGWAGIGHGGFQNVYYGPRRNMMTNAKVLTLMNNKKGVATAVRPRPDLSGAPAGNRPEIADRESKPTMRPNQPVAREEAPVNRNEGSSSKPTRTRTVTTLASSVERQPYVNPEYSADVSTRPSVPAFRNTGQEKPIFIREDVNNSNSRPVSPAQPSRPLVPAPETPSSGRERVPAHDIQRPIMPSPVTPPAPERQILNNPSVNPSPSPAAPRQPQKTDGRSPRREYQSTPPSRGNYTPSQSPRGNFNAPSPAPRGGSFEGGSRGNFGGGSSGGGSFRSPSPGGRR